jgi:hypothetical protein
MGVANDETRPSGIVILVGDESQTELSLDLDIGLDIELEGIGALDEFKFVYALAARCLEYEAAACTGEQSKEQVAWLLDRLSSIEWLVAG